MIPLRHAVASPVDKGNIGLHEYIALEHVETGTGRLLPGIEIEKKEDPQAVRYEPGDVLFGKLRPYLHKVYQPDREGLCSAELLVLRPKTDELSPRYLYYLVLSKEFKDWAAAASYGVKMPRTSWELLASYPIPDLPLRQQRLIAGFLDRETHRIDALVDAKLRMVDLLEEKLTATITTATTRGVEPGVDVKPSGVSWIGNVPSHWSVAPIGARYDLQLGKMLNQEAASGEDQYPYLRNVNVQWWDVDLEDLATMSFSERERHKYRLEPGDLLVCEGGEVGRAAIWRGELAECFFQKALHRVRPRHKDDSRFLAYVLHAAASMEVFRIEGNQSTIVHLTGEQLRAHRVGFPPPPEQESIADYLDRKRRVIKSAVDSIRSQLALLAEYRQALITQAVTGQLDEATLKGDRPVDEAVGVVPK